MARFVWIYTCMCVVVCLDDIRFLQAGLPGHVLHQQVRCQVEELFCPFLQQVKTQQVPGGDSQSVTYVHTQYVREQITPACIKKTQSYTPCHEPSTQAAP